jgi:putative ABC transport system permease protein
MIQNYFKIAFRNILKNKGYSTINVLGLSIGLAVSMLILLFVSHELSYDKFHKNQANIFQIAALLKIGEQEINLFNMSQRVGDALQESTPSVKDVGRKSDKSKATFETDLQHRYDETGLIFADEGFFRLFDFKIIQGDAQSLSRPYTIMLTPEMAQKYFGTENPIGKTIIWNQKEKLEVTGIVAKSPSNSSIQFDLIGSLPTLLAVKKAQKPNYYTPEKLMKFGAGDFDTYLLLDNAQNQANVAVVLNQLAAQNTINNNITFSLNHFASAYMGLEQAHLNDRVKYVYIFSGVALLILMLALINFMNLTTARATTRAKEVGVRKTIGASQLSLNTQFYIESTITVLLSLVCAIILFELSRPIFYKILDLKIETRFLLNPYFLLSVGTILVVSILLSGSYPAFVLSRFNPAQVLKGQFIGKGNTRIRQVLTVFQLAVSSGLIFCSIVIFSQIKTMRSKHLGLNKEQIVTIDLDEKAKTKNQAFMDEIKQIKGIKGVSGSDYRMFEEGFNMLGIRKLAETDENKNIATLFFHADANYTDLFEMEWKIKPLQMPSNLENKIILNETAALAIDADLINLKAIESGGDKPIEVIGIVKDFNYGSTKQKVEPLMMFFNTEAQDFSCLNIKMVKNEDIVTTMTSLEQAYDRYKAEATFNYHFADEAFDKLFKSEERIAQMFGVLTMIAIFIACLGLLGLITFMAEQKTKEIGIRKVLGASIAGITGLLAKDFLKLVLIAIVIASPIAYYFMNKWLADFAYRIDIQAWMFVAAGLAAVLIAFLTVGFQSVKAAWANPVKSLRSE